MPNLKQKYFSFALLNNVFDSKNSGYAKVTDFNDVLFLWVENDVFEF